MKRISLLQYNNNVSFNISSNNSTMFNKNANSNSSNAIQAKISKQPSKSLISNETNKVKAKVLFDFEAGDVDELDVSANEVIFILIYLLNIEFLSFKFQKVIFIQIIPNDNDWIIAQRGEQLGKVPKAYIQIAE